MNQEVARYLENWQDEIESAFLYRALAKVEQHPNLAEVYRKLATTEETHAKFWEEKLLSANYPIPRRKIGWRTKALALLAKQFRPQFILPTVNAMEQVDSHSYDAQTDTHDTQLPVEERSHARLLQAITSSSSAGMEGSTLAQIEGRHRTAGGNSLRAAVLGASDGLLSNLSLVMGDELGGSAWGAAITSFFLFALGAIVPVTPFIFGLTGITAVFASLVGSGLALFLIGAGITLLTGRSILYSGTRQVIFGYAAAAVTYGIGRLMGVSLGG